MRRAVGLEGRIPPKPEVDLSGIIIRIGFD
jgi:hypothetical protein